MWELVLDPRLDDDDDCAGEIKRHVGGVVCDSQEGEIMVRRERGKGEGLSEGGEREGRRKGEGRKREGQGKGNSGEREGEREG